jgi:DNA-binding PadR family transcriptional regulator
MPRNASISAGSRPGLVGLFALSLMERQGPVHGYKVSESISERTEGAWRPGPGAVYPSLQKLSLHGYARRRKNGSRQEYAITPAGRLLLRRLRTRSARPRNGRGDASMLWAEIVGAERVGDFLLDRLRRNLEALRGHLAHLPRNSSEAQRLRSEVREELRHSAQRFSRGRPSRRVRSRVRGSA